MSDVTVIVVPRERFSLAERSLRSIYDATRRPFRLVYVDGASPRHVRRRIEAASREHGFTLLRTEYPLSPNEARNLGVRAASATQHIVFVDNDVLVSPGWLESLVRCADETGAWIVGPLYLIGSPGKSRVHMAGGEARIVERDGRRVFHERHLFANRPLADVRPQLERGPCELVEFHALLIRHEVLDRIGPLDEKLLSLNEHVDVCMRVREAGGEVYFEPESVVTYVPPPPWGRGDRSYYLLRWSDAWARATQRRFAEQWDLPADDRMLRAQMHWTKEHRWLLLRTLLNVCGREFGRFLRRRLGDRLDGMLERRIVSRELARRASAGV